MSDLERQMMDYRLTTAEILYHMPDHPDLLQTFIWQTLDIAPRYPVLRKFLDFWQRELEGPLHSVKVAHRRLISPAEVRMVTETFRCTSSPRSRDGIGRVDEEPIGFGQGNPV